MKTKQIILIVLTAILFSFTGCKAKKKTTEREKVKEEIVTEVKTKDVVSVTEKLDSTATGKTENFKVEVDEEIELTQADPDKVITIEDQDGNKLTITGADAKIKKTEKQETAIDTFSATISKRKDTVQETTTESATEINRERKSRKSDVDIKSFLGYWWILLIILVVGYLLYRWYKTTPAGRIL